MTEEKERKINLNPIGGVNSESEAIEALKSVIDFINGNIDVMSADVKKHIEGILAAYLERFDVFLIMYCNSKTYRIQKLMNALERIEDRLLEDTTIAGMNTRELLQTHAAVRGSESELVEMLMQLRKIGINPKPEYIQNIYNVSIANTVEAKHEVALDVDNVRPDRVLSAIQRIMNKAKGEN